MIGSSEIAWHLGWADIASANKLGGAIIRVDMHTDGRV
jgi:hypothetical protein